ncbi:MAG TPA: hypothetical protein VFC26_05710 [Verrucomicrobiae bacterium]|nr:hypothetical protein [Verrucomicrobiae bacterium]
MPGTLTAFTMRPGANGEQTFARSAPLYVDARDLAANTNETHTVPAGADFVIFSADGDFYAKPNGAAAVPSDVTDGTASELNPVVWDLSGVTSIGLIASAVRKVTLSFYKGKNA